MTEEWIWTLIASLILLAIGTSLKSAHDTFLFKKSDKEIARLLSEIEALNKSHDETISGILKSHAAEVKELSERHIKLPQFNISFVSAEHKNSSNDVKTP